MREILVGSGFYSNPITHRGAVEQAADWYRNTFREFLPHKIIVVDNSVDGCPPLRPIPCDIIRVSNNLGHVGDAQARHSQFAGWSMSWIIPAMIAYSENCDFVYKEQDCFAFGNWLPQIRKGRASFGNHWQMPCEQSLFWIERDFIPNFVQVYLSIPEPDFQCVPEGKFKMLEEFMPNDVKRFDLGVGRNRPLPADPHAGPWYAQKLVYTDFEWLRREGLL